MRASVEGSRPSWRQPLSVAAAGSEPYNPHADALACTLSAIKVRNDGWSIRLLAVSATNSDLTNRDDDVSFLPQLTIHANVGYRAARETETGRVAMVEWPLPGGSANTAREYLQRGHNRS